MTGSDSSKSSHPSCSRLPASPSPGDVAAFLDSLQDFRRALWTISASRPTTRCSRTAYRVRETLATAEDALHELRRCLEIDAIVRVVPTEE